MSSLLILFSWANDIGHHRIVAGDEQKRSFVPHSHAILAAFVLFRFCTFFDESLHACLSY